MPEQLSFPRAAHKAANGGESSISKRIIGRESADLNLFLRAAPAGGRIFKRVKDFKQRGSAISTFNFQLSTFNSKL
ncbi:MAG: hypothetical protein LBP75_09635 [Planctomycetota bacterium]|jgi:hypothetical protein|nr:hypothetical protein [Planctomycetota bacterium]